MIPRSHKTKALFHVPIAFTNIEQIARHSNLRLVRPKRTLRSYEPIACKVLKSVITTDRAASGIPRL
jgi:hypothetical protein